MEIVGKLTPRSLGWDRNALGTETAKVPADGGKVLIGRIVGIVAGLRQTVNNDTGEVQSGLKGNFRGISSKTLEGSKDPITVTSGVCYLPGGIQDMIEGALAAAKEADPKATVNFAIDLYGIPATNKAGYSFKADNIVAPEQADPLDMLMQQAETNVKALAAPAAEPEAEKAPAKTK